MAKSKKLATFSKTVRETQKAQKSAPKKTPNPKVFKVISEVRSSVSIELFEGGMDFAGILKVVNERGGRNINKSFQPLLDSTIEAAGTSEVPVKVSWKKKTPASDAGTFETEAATTDVADVSKRDVPYEGTVGITQESEVVVDKGMTKLKPKRLRKKDVINPAVGDNLMEIEEAVEEEAEEEETLQVRSRRQLQKATSSLGAKSVDSEETKSDEHIEENPSDQLGGSDVDAGMGDEKEDEEVEEDEDDDVGQREGKGTIVEEEEDEKEEEEEDENDEDLESEEGEVRRPPPRKFHLGVLSRRRLMMPHKKMMKRYADVLLGSSSRGVRMALDSLPRAHELALVMRNVTELSALSGHSLRHSLRMDVIRKRYRKEIRRVRAENDRLDEELTSEKQRLIELATASMELKADVEKVTNEWQMVEEENKKLRAELEREKAKGKRLRERLVLLQNDLCDKTLKNERLHDALNETSQKLIKV
ncbi:hypothetical protein Dimus_008338 [Dionaea muscipula]